MGLVLGILMLLYREPRIDKPLLHNLLDVRLPN